MARIDLDARRAEEGTHTVVLNGREYVLPGSMPLTLAELMAAGEFRESIRVLIPGLAEEDLDRLTLEDVKAIGSGCYGLSFPESSASSVPSGSTGPRSTLTSLASTG